MKKRTILLILALIMLVSACGGSKKTLDVKAFGQKVHDTIDFEVEMTHRDDDVLNQLYGIEDADIKQRSFYVSTGYTPEEIIVIEATDAEAAARVEAAFRQRVEDQREAFTNYIPEQRPKLNDPPIKRNGNYAAMVISGFDEKAASLINDFFKGN